MSLLLSVSFINRLLISTLIPSIPLRYRFDTSSFLTSKRRRIRTGDIGLKNTKWQRLLITEKGIIVITGHHAVVANS
ncbi:MAG TPA: hypothetical protein VN726_22265 [Hanamia sp.]|nr:hypothetical protein [Hanamia sp.]